MKYEYIGIDVSKHQGKIDWTEAVKEIDFIILRAGYGMYITQKDSFFDENMQKLIDNNMKNIGIYWFSYATSKDEAKKEAEICLQVIKEYKDKINLPVFFDQEYCKPILALTNAQRTECCKAFIETIQAAGYKSGLYASKDWLDNKVDVSALPSSSYIWVAQYAGSCTYKGKYQVWQHSSKGKIAGINGNVDLDKATADFIPASPAPKWEKTGEGWKYGDVKNAWKQLGGYWYWFDDSGIAVTGWKQIKGVWYYFLTAADAAKTGIKECACMSVAK